MDIDELVNPGLDISPPNNNGGDDLGRKRTREEVEEETASNKRVTKNGNNDDDVEMEDKAGEEGTKNDYNNNNSTAKEEDASEIDGGEVELVSRFASSQMQGANAVICTGDGCERVACATLMKTMGAICSDVCYDCGLELFGVPVADLTLVSNYTDTIRELSTTKEDLLVQPIQYTGLEDLPFEGTGAYSAIPGAAIALNGSLSFSNGRMSDWINNDTIIQLHASATREDEATYMFNTLRNLMQQYKHSKRGEIVRLGNAYEGLDTAGAEESIRNKFMSVVARIEFTHYTDIEKIEEFGNEMLAIWRYHKTQADVIESDEFKSIEETLRDAVMRFWTD